ncbi:lysosomal-associated transmembrane protein 5 isoform X1 [Gorilla gorilla gorilla]|uniref:lysosomal-associated transmembrane protein 5 isoform X1 n=1 Tax=Gorilla gorilla gorilla TaxID=9595 RepID=UPI0008F4B354|nr:lysosomal-associated transmembrane protein 5 isoform X1 [Gorilla gorilla gorilla]
MAREILEPQGSKFNLVGSPGPQERGNRVHTPAGPRDTGHIMSVLLFIEHSVEVAHGKASCKLSQMGYLRIADLISSFLLITMLFIISLSLLIGVVKNREKYLLPFLSLQIMDYLLCLLTLLGSYIELPAYLKLASRSRASPSKFPLMTLQLLDFCLSILTLCSSYMEVPTYLNFKSMNHMNYLPSQEDMPHNQFIKMMIIFSIAFITVLIFKVYMFKCVWRCYKFIKCMNSVEEKRNSKMLQKVVLPSYEEALSLPSKTPEGGPAPPPYSEV